MSRRATRIGRGRLGGGLPVILSALRPLALAALCLTACAPETPGRLGEEKEDVGPNVERGRELVAVYACAACHAIPGIRGAPGGIGPPLEEWSRRRFIAGRLPNEPKELIRWLRNPEEVDPGTAMPDLGISKEEAIDMAAFLFSL